MENLGGFTTLHWMSVGFISGLFSHWTYFIRGEHHLTAPFISLLAILSPVGFCLWLYLEARLALQSTLVASISLFGSFYGALFTSIVVYRVIFHPLRAFPGPPLSKITQFYQLYLRLQENNFSTVARLHEQYGPIVRTGPAELSVMLPEAVPLFYGPKSKCKKAPFYDMGTPVQSLHTSRDQRVHNQRRKVWDNGFSAKALQEFEKRELVYVHQLDDIIASKVGEEVDASQIFNFFSFDVMGDLAFGVPFDMLKDKREHFASKILHDGQSNLAWITPVPWLAIVLNRIPGIMAGQRKFLKWCMEQVEKRRKVEMENPDLMSWLLAESNKARSKTVGDNWLRGDSRLIVVAGSDTTAVTLTHIFFYLARHPEQVEKLRSAIDPILSSVGWIENRHIQNVDHLNGVINEVLRLHPPVPSGVLRVSPPEGVQVGDSFIPGDTTVSVPFLPIGRSEIGYVNPEEFIPERWYSKPELIRDKNAFSPFSLGSHSCIGKNLALMELRTVTALLVYKYDVSLAPGEDGSRLLNDCFDAFTLFVKDLRLVFRERKHVAA